MRFQIDNIGKVRHADIEIDGITIIGGDNDTGKSTIGRALFSIFTALHDINTRISKDRKEAIRGIFLQYCFFHNLQIQDFESSQIINQIIKDKDKYIENKELLLGSIKEFLDDNTSQIDDLPKIPKSKREIDILSQKIENILNLSDEDVVKRLINRTISEEFSGQINNLYISEPADLCLSINKKDTKIVFVNNKVETVSRNEKTPIQIAPVYIDDPLAIDYLSFNARRYTRTLRASDNKTNSLINKLKKDRIDTAVSSELIIDEKFNEIFSQVSNIAELKIVEDKEEHGKSYQDANSGKVLEIANLSTGLKSFLILKRLIENGSIENRGLVIIDEPEVHLHPEWQILYAELIVLMQKTFNLHILINTHSPYFLRAIEVYSAKHKISDRCNYYLSGLEDNFAVFEDCTTCIEKIYAKLASPLNKLDQIKLEVEMNE